MDRHRIMDNSNNLVRQVVIRMDRHKTMGHSSNLVKQVVTRMGKHRITGNSSNLVRQVVTHMVRHRIMGNSSNNIMPNKHKLLHMDNNTDTSKHKIHTNKVTLSKTMVLMEIHTANNNNTVVIIKANNDHKVSLVHLQVEGLKCHTMELHHNHNLKDQPGREIHRRMLKQENYLSEV